MTEELTPYGLTEEEFDITSEMSQKCHAAINGNITGAVKKITDALNQEIYDYVMEMMESDTQYNFAGLVRTRVNNILKGMLSGGWDEATAKKWLEGYDFEKYRKDIYVANKDVIQNKLLDELLEKNAKLEEDLKWARKRYE